MPLLNLTRGKRAGKRLAPTSRLGCQGVDALLFDVFLDYDYCKGIDIGIVVYSYSGLILVIMGGREIDA